MITNKELWNDYVTKNTDPYGACCIKVASKAMEILDQGEAFEANKLISEAEGSEGITGFMAGCVAQMISECHSRGEEFRKKWNTRHQIGSEGDEANKSGGILNPAILNIG
jgi:hypothetical protein